MSPEPLQGLRTISPQIPGSSLSSSAKIEELRKKFDENPRRYFAPLANEYRKAGDFDQAIFICQEYLPQQPGHMSGHIVFGQALFEAKRLPEAKNVFETALSLDPENLIALRHLADISRDLGDLTAARTWYERVLHADPRNEEIAAIMETLSSGATAATAPTADIPAPQAPTPVARTLPDAASAPTVELSAAAVQEMMKARMAAKQPPPLPTPEPAPEVELLTLDAAPTVEVRQVEAPSSMLDGLEPTSHAAPTEMPAFETLGLEPTSHAAPTEMPAFETLGLETNMAPGQQPDAAPAAAPVDGLDTIPLDISLPDAAPMTPTMEIPAVRSAPEPAAAGDDGLMDLGSFSFGGSAPSPAAAAPSPVETPIDGGHDDGLELLDLDIPGGAPAAPAPEPVPELEELSVPTMVIDAVKSVAPAVKDAVESTIPFVMDAIESAAPTVMDFVGTTIPPVVDAVQETVPQVVEAVVETPTVIMEAIKEPPARKDVPAPTPAGQEPRTSQSVPIVTETMAQLYLSQGHRDEAIDIYRKLIEARPGDAQLRARLAAIEEAPRPQAPAATRPEPAPTPPPARFSGSGPSIRTVLRELFGLNGSEGGHSVSGVPGEVGSIDMLFSSESVADALSPLAVAFDGGYVAAPGDIDELFAGGAR